MFVVKERISFFSWNDAVFSTSSFDLAHDFIIYILCSLHFFLNHLFCRTGNPTFAMYCSCGLAVFCYEFSMFIFIAYHFPHTHAKHWQYV
jgi:hypothetical protein